MWDQESGINVSALDGTRRIGGSASIEDKKIFESSGGDSGFLSGPQTLYSSESIDSEHHQSHDSHQSHSDIVPDKSEPFRDSGAIVGDFDDEQDDTKDTKQDPMIFKSGVDVGLSEWFCELKIKNSSAPTNNLSGYQETSVEEPKVSKFKGLTSRQLFEICYVQDADGDTQLHLAILGKRAKAVWSIIRLAPVPAFLDIRNDNVHSALHYAVLTKQPQIVRWLLAAGAKPTVVDGQGNTPLHMACMNRDKECVAALTRPITLEEQRHYDLCERIPQVLPFDLEQRNYYGEVCVHIAAERNDTEILGHLISMGADINAKEGRSGYTALHFACESGNVELVEYLLQYAGSQLDTETRTWGQLTAYQLAACNNNRYLMSAMEKCGAEALMAPDSDDDSSYFEDSDDEYNNYQSDDCELN